MEGRLGLDANNAHVQPTGTYHYHGLPTGLMTEQGSGGHSPFDRARCGRLSNSMRSMATQTASLRSRHLAIASALERATAAQAGSMTGTFIEDYYYVEGAGSLDACNGKGHGHSPNSLTVLTPISSRMSFPMFHGAGSARPSKTGFEKQRPNNPGANGQRPPPGGSNGQRPRSGNGNPPPPGRDGRGDGVN